jgi:hypothetical protein
MTSRVVIFGQTRDMCIADFPRLAMALAGEALVSSCLFGKLDPRRVQSVMAGRNRNIQQC